MTAKESSPTERPGPEEAINLIARSRLTRVLGGRWKLESILGFGGTATVYAARHRNGRRVAIKVLHPELCANPNTKRRFLSEGYAANKVRHPGAVAILDDAEDPDGTVFLVVELLSGRTAAQRFAESGRRLPVSEVVRIGFDVLDVLAAAHDESVLHRDVKPSNVFLCDDGSIKLLDFGIARIQDEATELESITWQGAPLGTPAFMAPELAAGRSHEVDALTDIWSLGATMFQLLTGETVHPAKTAQEAIILAATAPARSIHSVAPGLPPLVGDTIDRALAFERAHRWPNARTMQQALLPQPAGSTRSNPDPQATIPEHPARIELLPGQARRSRARIWLSFAVLSVAVAATFRLVVTSKGRLERPTAVQPATMQVSAPVLQARDPVETAPSRTSDEVPGSTPATPRAQRSRLKLKARISQDDEVEQMLDRRR